MGDRTQDLPLNVPSPRGVFDSEFLSRLQPAPRTIIHTIPSAPSGLGEHGVLKGVAIALAGVAAVCGLILLGMLLPGIKPEPTQVFVESPPPPIAASPKSSCLILCSN